MRPAAPQDTGRSDGYLGREEGAGTSLPEGQVRRQR